MTKPPSTDCYCDKLVIFSKFSFSRKIGAQNAEKIFVVIPDTSHNHNQSDTNVVVIAAAAMARILIKLGCLLARNDLQPIKCTLMRCGF